MTAARVGIGGPVGSGKTALIEAMLGELARQGIDTAVITNDLVTDEDAERLRRGGQLPPDRVRAVQAGACPHTVIREDPTLNMAAADRLEADYPGLDLILLESGGDILASTFSPDLVDFWMFVIDVAGGDDIPRKKGPGIVQSNLLVINKVDLAPMVGASLEVMERDAKKMRGDKPFVFSNQKIGQGLDEIIAFIERHGMLSAA